MLSPESGAFISLPSTSDQRVLIGLEITGVLKGQYGARFPNGQAPQGLEPGQDVLIYYERNREFVQQSARIVDAPLPSTVLPDPDQNEQNQALEDLPVEDQPELTMTFELTGQPVSAEQRQCYRVCTVISGMTATLNGEPDCPIQDVSATGFSVIATGQYQVGRTLGVELAYGQTAYEGRISVQSVREMGSERYRYGLHCLASSVKTGLPLERGLQQICMDVQRQQLRRLKAAG